MLINLLTYIYMYIDIACVMCTQHLRTKHLRAFRRIYINTYSDMVQKSIIDFYPVLIDVRRYTKHAVILLQYYNVSRMQMRVSKQRCVCLSTR